jgi:hypothetical protein
MVCGSKLSLASQSELEAANQHWRKALAVASDTLEHWRSHRMLMNAIRLGHVTARLYIDGGLKASQFREVTVLECIAHLGSSSSSFFFFLEMDGRMRSRSNSWKVDRYALAGMK